MRTVRTPLHWATTSEKHSLDLVELLIRKGAKVNQTDNYGMTPLNKAFYDEDKEAPLKVVLYLIAHGANPHKEDNSNRTPLNKAKGTWIA